MTAILTEDDVRDAMRTAITKSGVSQVSWCRSNGLDPSHCSLFLGGHRGPGPTALQVLGFEKCYRPAISALQSLAEGVK